MPNTVARPNIAEIQALADAAKALVMSDLNTTVIVAVMYPDGIRELTVSPGIAGYAAAFGLRDHIRKTLGVAYTDATNEMPADERTDGEPE